MAIPGLNSLSGFSTTAQALGNLILVSPNLTGGYQPYAISGPLEALGNTELPTLFVFQYEGEQSVSCESDITDHYVEDNTSIQDQIALKPERITTQGFIGELNDVLQTDVALVYNYAQKLSTIPAFEPTLTTTAQLAYTATNLFYQNLKNNQSANISAWSSLINIATQSKQQIAFQQFYGWWINRILFSVQTPWAIFKNMAIQSLRPVQSAETRMITTFEITFKKIRTTNEAVTLSLTDNSQTRLSAASAPIVNLGSSQPRSNVSVGQKVCDDFHAYLCR